MDQFRDGNRVGCCPGAAGGFRRRLPSQSRDVLRTALVGLYKAGGADLVRQQIAAACAPAPPPYELTVQGLVVWPDAPTPTKCLRAGQQPEVEPQVLSGVPRRWPPVLDRTQLVFRDIEVAWQQWIAAWEEGRPAGNVSGRLPPGNDFWQRIMDMTFRSLCSPDFLR